MLTILMASYFLAVPAHAQDSAGLDDPNDVSDFGAPDEVTDPKVMAEYGPVALKKVQDATKTVKKLYTEAVEKGDAELKTCVLRKVSDIQLLERTAIGSQAPLQDAVNSGNLQVAQFQYNLLVLTVKNAERVRDQAEACEQRSSNDDTVTRIDVDNPDEDAPLDDITDELDDDLAPPPQPPMTRMVP